MAGCSVGGGGGDAGDVLQFCGVLPLLAFTQTKLSSEEPFTSHCVPPAVNTAEIDAVEEVKVMRVDPPLSQALSEAEALLQKTKARRTHLEKELAEINTQLADIMSCNEELREEVKRAEKMSMEVSSCHTHLLQTQTLRADDLMKEVEQFRSGELKVLEEEVYKLQEAQQETLKNLTAQTKLCDTFLHCLKAKEKQVHEEVWKLEDSATLLQEKGRLWRMCEETTKKAGEEGRERHNEAAAALEEVTRGFVEVTSRAEEVCVSLTPHTPLSQHSSPSHTPPHTSSPS